MTDAVPEATLDGFAAPINGTGIRRYLTDNDVDLIVIEATVQNFRLRNFLFGSIPAVVADTAECSVLAVRRYLPGATQTVTLGRGLPLSWCCASSSVGAYHGST